MDKCVCLISGGLDSCVAAAVSKTQGLELASLHVGYGQRTARQERQAFEAISDFFEINQRLSLQHPIGQVGGSALTDHSIPVPKGQLDSGIPPTYVPFRNANFLSVAVGWAEVIGARKLVIGAVQEDSSGYPDCRELFFKAFEQVIAAGTRPETSIQILTPLLHLSKSEIVRTGLELGAPLHLTWSCYEAGELPCGTCESCLLRLRGFQTAGHPDPLAYR